MQKRKLTFGEITLIIILVLAIIGLCAVGVVVFRNMTAQGEESPKTTSAPPTSSPTSPAVESGLCLLDGQLVVGTSADYPPFETFTNDFKLDGFDIALIKEVGTRLGVQVLIRNMAFEGLGDALKLNQINTAISAISVTPEREKVYAFSNIYLVGSEGILAPAGSTQEPITSPLQIVSQRVGVQAGSIYQRWVQTTLVETGQMPAGNLNSYVTIDLAVNDLITGKIDLVILDEGPAQKFANQGSAKLVGAGLSQQRYAIGFSQDCLALRDLVNVTLAQIQNDGRLDELIQQYFDLDVEDIIPLPTPIPPTPIPPTIVAPTSVPVTATAPPANPTATPLPTCVDGMAFVQDLTYPDQNITAPPVIPPGTPFQKGWRIQNTGTCTWDHRYFLNYAGGNTPYSRMGGVPTSIVGLVPPGGFYDIFLNLVAPITPGVYQGFWEMNNSRSVPFGERIWVGITVPPTNPATPTPAPNIPQIYRFLANPTSIQVGQCVQISWEVVGAVTVVNIFNNGNPIWVNGPAIGTLQDCPTSAGAITYEIQANGPGGTARADQTVNVADTPPPTATPAPMPPPVISFFNVQPDQIELGGCVSLDWGIDGTVAYVRLLRNGQAILDNAANVGNASDCPPAPGSTIYRLEASGAGQSTSSERAVNVNQPAQPPPFANQNWTLTNLSDRQGNTPEVLAGTEITAIFDANGNVQGAAGCNTYSGRYTAAGNSMTIVVDMNSLMTCTDPPGVMEQEALYFSLLQSTSSYQQTNNQLMLYGGNNTLLLVFELGASPR
jgi:polar amino acid transport system substrate-binding protein